MRGAKRTKSMVRMAWNSFSPSIYLKWHSVRRARVVFCARRCGTTNKQRNGHGRWSFSGGTARNKHASIMAYFIFRSFIGAFSAFCSATRGSRFVWSVSIAWCGINGSGAGISIAPRIWWQMVAPRRDAYAGDTRTQGARIAACDIVVIYLDLKRLA